VVDAARTDTVPPRVAVAVADLSAQLREAELGEGKAVLAGDAAATERAQRAQERLGAQVAHLEEAHRAYEAWSSRRGMSRVRAEAARAELALRAEALVTAPAGSWSRLRWKEETAHAEAQAETMQAVLSRHESKAATLAAALAAAEASLTRDRRQRPSSPPRTPSGPRPALASGSTTSEPT